ncbi:PCNA-interacting partner [Chionoecetes opilio]|uniref:PCNA-interacting partner n=1 Tax=Chionoecetes opilio TaxID=41210 RepID=A0A8J5C925_CHIOP|nr:PCNA-interacting partner [Chionoecetes opilio]
MARDLLSDTWQEVFIIEGLEQLPLMERALLKLVSEGSQVYRVHAELPFSEAIPPSPSTLNISGIHESSILKTPSRCNEQETVQSDSMTPEFKATNAPQTPTPQHRHQADQTDSTTDNAKTTHNPQTPCHDTRQTDQTDSVRRNTQEKAIIQVERVEGSMTEVVDGAPHYAAKAIVSSESEAYIERLFLAHLRLLVNTRDELALTLACSMPGREITHQGFTDIRQEAQRKEMPMYQTILSLILRQRLGGKGYQADPNNPVLLHAKPLGEFVDALMKLQNILEGQTDARQGATRVLNGIKTGLGKMKGCMLRRSTIEAVAERLCVALQHLMEHLVHLCDVAGGQAGGGGVVDALGDDLLSQLTSTKKGPHNTPSGYTPSSASSGHQWEGCVTEQMEWRRKTWKQELGGTLAKLQPLLHSLRARSAHNPEVWQVREDAVLIPLLGGDCFGLSSLSLQPLFTKQGIGVAGKPRSCALVVQAGAEAGKPSLLYKSDCSWAPIDLSPITASMQDTSASPIAGPSLKVVGRAARHSSGGSKESVASLTRDKDNGGDPPSEGRSSPPQPSSPVTPRRLKDNNNKPKKARSKRSLLKDISNLENKSEETQEKKQKVMPGNKEGAKRRKEKSKPLLQGQRSITSFFRS